MDTLDQQRKIWLSKVKAQALEQELNAQVQQMSLRDLVETWEGVEQLLAQPKVPRLFANTLAGLQDVLSDAICHKVTKDKPRSQTSENVEKFFSQWKILHQVFHIERQQEAESASSQGNVNI